MKIFLKIIGLQIFLITPVYAQICESEALISNVLKQVNMKRTEGALIDCKTDPQNDSQIIMAYAAWNPETEDEGAGSYRLNLFKWNKDNQKISYHYTVADELISDAVSLTSIQLDTANYKINQTNRALGMRLHYSLNSSVNPFSMTVLNLYDLQNKKQVLDSFIVDRYRAETDTRCNADVEERKSTVIMQNSKSKNYFDIQVRSNIDHYTFSGTRENCKESKHKLSQQSFILKFDGKQYQFPKQFKDEYHY